VQKVHTKGLRNVHISLNRVITVLKVRREDETCSTHWDITYSCILVEKPERKVQIGRPGHSWKHASDIKSGLTEHDMRVLTEFSWIMTLSSARLL
jgi:hypothetical protein